MALPHHDAAHGHKTQRTNAIFLGTKDRRDHNVAAGFQPAVGAQFHPVAKAIERQHLIGFG